MLLKNVTPNELNEIGPGETRRFDHKNCPAGEDTRRRLYVTRTQADPDKLIYYCHNCSKGGAHKENSWWESYRDARHDSTLFSASISHKSKVEEPKGLVFNPDNWPAQAKALLIQRGTAPEVVSRWGIAYDPSSDRLYFPQYKYMDSSDYSHEFEGYQLRAVGGYATPKYITARNPDSEGFTIINGRDNDPSNCICFIVEDYLSGIKLIEALQYDYMVRVGVNYGTRINPALLYELQGPNNFIIVWLDNDSEEIIKQAHHYGNTAKLFKNELVRVIDNYSDPKNLDPSDIKMIIEKLEETYGQS